MTWLSYKLSAALAQGRQARRLTREQIRWALPLRRAAEAEGAAATGDAEHDC